MSKSKTTPPSRNRTDELQRLLGDAGVVLPRVAHGSFEFPAQGWYAKLKRDGKVYYLGDYSSLAGARIAQLLGGVGNGSHPSFLPGEDGT